jgi:hypothetical protein
MVRRLAIVAALAALMLVLLWRVAERTAGPAGMPAGGRAGPPAASASVAPGSPAGVEHSEYADRLGTPGGDALSDMRALDGIFEQYRSGIHGLNPVGENREITAVLTGHNKLGFAFIPPGHPAINDRGELCDRLGTPYFFHQISGSRMEIRSAGPDRKLWTDDDVVFTPPGLAEPPR